MKLVVSFIDPAQFEAAEASGAKSSGVNQAFIVAVAKVTESYESLEALLDLIGAKNASFQFNGDLKVLALLLGLQNQASSFPCIFCISAKGELQFSGELRSISGITNHAKAFHDFWR